MKRAFIIVLDSFGVGFMPDAADFGDVGANTLKRISGSQRFHCDNLLKMGLGNINGVDYLPSEKNPTAAVMKMTEKSRGKDTTTGHWEMMGVISKKPMPTFPNGFPREILDEFSCRTGRGILCNKVYSGTQVIHDYGREHLETGKLIVYTSADSVFQVAAHESIVSNEQLYEYCKTAREILKGDLAVGRVIARPFAGQYPDFERTPFRRDFSLCPPVKTVLDEVKQSGKEVISVGKISDIFAGCGITRAETAHGNSELMKKADMLAKENFNGLCFVNLVDFDMKYGHRQDIDGYAGAFSEFDSWVGGFVKKLGEKDILMITGDHGCDPGDNSTDHTREYTPLIVYGKKILPGEYGIRETFADIGKTAADWFGVETDTPGKSVLPEILRQER